MRDTYKTESADDQLDVGKGLSDQLGCCVVLLFWGVIMAVAGIVFSEFA